MKTLLVLALILLSGSACANTGSSFLAGTAVTSLALFPVIVFAEGWLYKKNQVAKPYLRSLAMNAFSSTVGNLIAMYIGLSSPFAKIFYYDKAHGSYPLYFVVPLAFMFHFTLSCMLEYGLAQVAKFPIGIKLLTRAHLISYGVIFVAWVIAGLVLPYFL